MQLASASQTPLRAIRAAALLLVALFAGACERTESAAPSPELGSRVVLESFALDGRELELSLSTCDADGCPFEIRWLERAAAVASFTAPIRASKPTATREPVDAFWGADPGLQAWASGIESEYVGIATRRFALDPGVSGLLVTQRYGFDHLKRLHRLLVPRARQLAIVWELDEAAGATWSATEILPTADGAPGELAVSLGRFAAEASEADRLHIARLVWDAAGNTLRAAPAAATGMRAAALVVGNFASVTEARAHRSASLQCLAPLWVLGSDSLPTLASGRAALGMIYARRERAEEAQRNLLACGAELAASVIDVPFAASGS